ncbi:rhodanese-like domain-containing protein [Mycolicibacterium sp. ND9-15]|uniref:rhodanese-like domain-containing protein n=1 Tax=Mycolicibacterium sp. ND9-15 TaxID=3042320 RepID=UPI002DD8A3B0|nr:rhodanese-like domain-containing protein [Mycolicibacterium sp. ND9-15]WSE58375.1 rhodanese-like domain-containing protein [Mycolicibacterium sp. ND9-15]
MPGSAGHSSVSRWLAGALTAFGVMVLGACASEDSRPTSTSHPETASAARLVDSDEFAAAIAEPARITLNVHVPFEGDIPGTDLSIPFDQIQTQADRLPADRDTALAIYCRSGPMSTVAAETLRDLGYTDVVELRGGMRAWQADGRPVLGI